MTAPVRLIAAHSRPLDTFAGLQLADGSEIRAGQYLGTVRWFGRELQVPVIEAGEGVLIGMALLSGFELRIQVVDGGEVSVRPL